ncbi:COG complex subunit 3 [Intoshia linei]|uniref:Conserved oligomeric Golgi complex subunit 3 n=1 Tax=Intoshia linei TaxID=1819745 RepID=A0A177AYB9_9BILA|nr:COG complex subunit 3 [Intoshia linei]
MTLKRQKNVKNILKYYETVCKLKPPYHILVDGTFCSIALKNKVDLYEQIPRYFKAQVHLYTTKCIISECKNFGKMMNGVVKILEQFVILDCSHDKNVTYPAVNCLKYSIFNEKYKTFIAATQDPDLSDKIRNTKLNPLLYLHGNSLTLESHKLKKNVLENDTKDETKRLKHLKRRELKQTINKATTHRFDSNSIKLKSFKIYCYVYRMNDLLEQYLLFKETHYKKKQNELFCRCENKLNNIDSRISDINRKYKKLCDKNKIVLKNMEAVKEKYNFLTENVAKMQKEHIFTEKCIQYTEKILKYFENTDKISKMLEYKDFKVDSEHFATYFIMIIDGYTFISENKKFCEYSKYHAMYKSFFDNVSMRIENYFNLQCVSLIRQVQLPKTQDENNYINVLFKLRIDAERAATINYANVVSLIENNVSKYHCCRMLLEKLYKMWIDCRRSIILSIIRNLLKSIIIFNSSSHINILKKSLSLISTWSTDETCIFSKCFKFNSPLLREFIEEISNYFYGIIREDILKTDHLETLTDMSCFLAMELADPTIFQNEVKQSPYQNFCLQLMGDVQERLIFKSYVYADSEIKKYNPSATDLNYPALIEMMNKIEKEQNKSNLNQDYSKYIGTSDYLGLYYPTIRRTIQCLIKLFRCLDKESFRNISLDVIRACIESILHAGQLLKAKNGVSESHLFVCKHFYVLRYHLKPFSDDLVETSINVDFSKIKNMMYYFSKNVATNEKHAYLNESVVDGISLVDEHIQSQKNEFCSFLSSILAESFLQSLTIHEIEHSTTRGRTNAKKMYDCKNKMNALKKEVAVMTTPPHYALFSQDAFLGSEHDYSAFKRNFKLSWLPEKASN